MARFDTDEGHELEDFLTDKQLYELSVQDWLNAEATLNN